VRLYGYSETWKEALVAIEMQGKILVCFELPLCIASSLLVQAEHSLHVIKSTSEM
jgi:hypothetical protein